MAAMVLELAGLEKCDDGFLAMRALHGLQVSVLFGEAAFAEGAGVDATFDPDSFALGAHDGIGSGSGPGGLAGWQPSAEAEGADEGEKSHFEFHRMLFQLVWFVRFGWRRIRVTSSPCLRTNSEKPATFFVS